MLEVSGTSVKETGSHNLDMRLQGTNGLSKRPTCKDQRARTHLPFYSILTKQGVTLPTPPHPTTVFLSCVPTTVTQN